MNSVQKARWFEMPVMEWMGILSPEFEDKRIIQEELMRPSPGNRPVRD